MTSDPGAVEPIDDADRLRSGKRTNFLARAATTLVLLIFCVYAVTNQDALSDLLTVPWTTLALVAVGRLLIFLSNGLFVKWTAEAFTPRLSVGEGIYVGILSAIGNFFGPLLGGASIRAVYLRRVHHLPYTKFTSTLMVYYVILFAINFAFALAGLLTLDLPDTPLVLLAIFGGGLMLLGLSVLVRLPRRLRDGYQGRSKVLARLTRYLIDIEEGWRRLLANPPLLVKLVGLASLSFGAQMLIAFVSFRAIGTQVSWAALVIYVAIVTSSLLIAITPGAIGIREAMLLIVSGTLGVTDADIIQVAVIDRGVNFALLLILFLMTRSGRLRAILTT